jgi:hypothetical protein
MDATKSKSRPRKLAICVYLFPSVFICVPCCLFIASPVQAQAPAIRIGEAVPRDVREIYDRGMQFLAQTQTEDGDWKETVSRARA